MDEIEIRAELEAILVALRESPHRLADLHLRTSRVFDALRAQIERPGGVGRDRELRLHDLITMFSEVEAALDLADRQKKRH